jgi:probable F420-dependent oxidoreductase
MVGPYELPPALPYVDPLDCLSFVAAATERILLGTGVLLLPYHHPVVLAKRLATIDVLSKGRMRLLTVGLGSLPGEARAVGVDFGSRGRRADEAIDVMRLLWEGGEEGVSFDGEFFSFENLCQFPKPYGVTRLPIHIGGSSRAAARRAGLRGDGYFPGGRPDPAERALQAKLAESSAVEAGRDPGALEYTRFGSIDMSVEQVEALAAQGVTRIVVSSAAVEPEEQRDEMSAFALRFGLFSG